VEGWWNAANDRPYIVARGWRSGYRVTVDLGSTERNGHLHAVLQLGHLLAECAIVSRFLIGVDTLEIDGVENQSMLTLTKGLVELVRDKRTTIPRSQYR
jgi:hypothetical protein